MIHALIWSCPTQFLVNPERDVEQFIIFITGPSLESSEQIVAWLNRYDKEAMIITRQKLRAIILEQLAGSGGAPRFNIRNNTSWERWVRERDLEEDEEEILDEEEKVFDQK